MLLLIKGRGVLTDWHWYRDLTHEQRLLYEELMLLDTEIHLSARDCKQLIRGLMSIGIKTPRQLRAWFVALAEADNDCECGCFLYLSCRTAQGRRHDENSDYKRKKSRKFIQVSRLIIQKTSHSYVNRCPEGSPRCNR